MIMKFVVISSWSSVIKHNTYDFFHVYAAQYLDHWAHPGLYNSHSSHLASSWTMTWQSAPHAHLYLQKSSSKLFWSDLTNCHKCKNNLGHIFLTLLHAIIREGNGNPFSKSRHATADFVNSTFLIEYAKLMSPNHWQQIIQPKFNTEIA